VSASENEFCGKMLELGSSVRRRLSGVKGEALTEYREGMEMFHHKLTLSDTGAL
jgi:hypothetical protein